MVRAAPRQVDGPAPGNLPGLHADRCHDADLTLRKLGKCHLPDLVGQGGVGVVEARLFVAGAHERLDHSHAGQILLHNRF